MKAIIDVEHLTFSYGSGELQHAVLKGLSVRIDQGEIVIITGPSGSGKTTFLTIIGALRHATEGSVRVMGKQLINSSEACKVQIRRQTGYIFQQHNLLKSLTAQQNVAMTLEMQAGFNETSRLARAAELLEAVGLADRLHYLPDQLSGGQRQRVSIARAMAGNPKLILADEPTASLDKQNGAEAVHLLKALAKERGTTIVLVTHDYRILDQADRVIDLEDGVIKSAD